MEYRREIDGLRALAVLPVILFHAGIKTFSGGFVGVDVFFVISGYLITTILLAELERGEFSVANFYERRARRILPALFLVMFFSIPMAWLWLPAPAMEAFSQSLAAVSTFSSNILFWHESGYFDTAAALKPLLHTWSVAVEEQYYVIYPLFLALIWPLGKRWTGILLGIVGIASLFVAQWGAITRSAAVFYLLPGRGWELLIGAFPAFYLSKINRADINKGLIEAGGALGLGLILYSVFAYDKQTPFPGLDALVPAVGAVLIILFSTQETAIGKFLGNRLLVGVGLISYSAYLWHQPLFAFFRYSGFDSTSSVPLLFLSAVSLLIAYLSWRFVESPFRRKSAVGSRTIVLLSVAGAVFFISAGLFGDSEDGFQKDTANATLQAIKVTNANFVVLGDSHGRHLISGLKAMTSGSVLDYTSDGCIPFRNVDRYDSRYVPGDCAKKMNAFLDKVSIEDPNAYVILSSMGPVYLDGTPFNGKGAARVTGLGVELITDKSIKDRWKVFEIGLRSTLTELSRLKNSNVIYAIDVPELGIDYGCEKLSKEIDVGPLKLHDLVEKLPANYCYVSRRAYDERSQRYKNLVRRVLSDFPKVKLFDPTNYFCDRTKCKGFDSKYGFLYRDVDHLSENGSIFDATKLLNFLGVGRTVNIAKSAALPAGGSQNLSQINSR